MSDKKTLYAKMARVMGTLNALQKDDTNKHFNYAYVSNASVYKVCREAMADENLAVFASMVEVVQSDNHTLAIFDFVIACGDSGETMTCRWFAEADDKQDKGVNKAATIALKYWLLKTFIIPTHEDDPDGDPPIERTTSGKPKRAPAKHAAAPPAPDDYDPLLDDRLFNGDSWEQLNAWMIRTLPHVESSVHAVNTLWLALNEFGDGFFEEQDLNALFAKVVDEKNFKRLYKAELQVRDIWHAISAYYDAQLESIGELT